MKSIINTHHFIFTLFVSFVISTALTACSSIDSKTTAKNKVHYANHLQKTEANNLEKTKLEQKIAEQCIAKEIRNSVNKDIDKKRFEKPCLCIAKKIMENLTVVQAEKLINNQKNSQSLIMRFNQASYFCPTF